MNKRDLGSLVAIAAFIVYLVVDGIGDRHDSQKIQRWSQAGESKLLSSIARLRRQLDEAEQYTLRVKATLGELSLSREDSDLNACQAALKNLDANMSRFRVHTNWVQSLTQGRDLDPEDFGPVMNLITSLDRSLSSNICIVEQKCNKWAAFAARASTLPGH